MRLRRFNALPARALGLAGLLGLFMAGPGLAAGYTVQAQNYVFVAPGGGSSLTITAGDQVTWVGSGDPHTVTSGGVGAIDDRFVDKPAAAGYLEAGDTFTTTFPTPGSFPYFCEVHGAAMSGLVTVVAGVTPPPTKAPTAPPTKPPTPAPTARPTPAPTPATTPAPTPSPTATEPAATATPSPSEPAGALTSPSAADGSPSPTASERGTSPTPSGAAEPVATAATSPILPIAGLLIVGGAVIAGVVLLRRRSTPG
jgi:plastocyanin